MNTQTRLRVYNLLKLMEVPWIGSAARPITKPGVFMLGMFDRPRVTVYAQQSRALNLIYALHKVGFVAPGKKVCVIGGGVAGLTAGVAAASLGCMVTILEKGDHVLCNNCRIESDGTIRSNDHRFIHPHIAEWPFEPLNGAANAYQNGCKAGLPLLSWAAGRASTVLDAIRSGYEAARREYPSRITERVNVAVSKIEVAVNAPGFTVHFDSAAKNFDLVIFAVGFGTDRDENGVPAMAYWKEDSLSNRAARPPRMLISGSGDGGLCDYLRCRIDTPLPDFDYFCALRTVLSQQVLTLGTSVWKQIENELCRIELTAIHEEMRGVSSETTLLKGYEDLQKNFVKPFAERIDRQLEKDRVQIRPETDTQYAILAGKAKHPYQLNASIFNRFLCSCLDVNRTYKRFPEYPPARKSPCYEVFFADGTSREFDCIVVRHGPTKPFATEFASIAGQCAWLEQTQTIDLTRVPIYDDSIFPKPVPSQSVLPHTPIRDGFDAEAVVTAEDVNGSD